MSFLFIILKKKAFYKSIRSAFSTLIIINVNHKLKNIKNLIKKIYICKRVPFQGWFCHLWAVHWGTEIYVFQETQKLADQEEHLGKTCTQKWQLIWNNMRRINGHPAAYIDYPGLPLLNTHNNLSFFLTTRNIISHTSNINTKEAFDHSCLFLTSVRTTRHHHPSYLINCRDIKMMYYYLHAHEFEDGFLYYTCTLVFN